jgi:2-oxoglutarate dehydrogenase E2 component (dihydrolipoamide succinyltransferase)
MPTDVIMPQMGESIFEGTLTKWLKKPGEKVQRDEPLFEISTDKVDAEIPAPASGVLKEIKVPEGTTVQVNTVVGVIDAEGAAAAAPAPQPTKAAGAPTAGAAAVAETPPPPKAPPPPGEAPGRQQPRPTEAPARRAEAPSAANRGDGGAAVPREGEEETEVPTYVRQRAAVEPEARPKEEQAVAAQRETVIEFPAHDRDLEGGRIRSSPLVRRIARDQGVNLAQVPGTGLGGRITKDDILSFIEQHPAGAPTAAPRPAAAVGAPMPLPAPTPAAIPGEVVPMTAMRKKIAEHMVMSKRTSAHVHSIFEINMTRIVRLREQLRPDWEKRNGTKLTYMPFFARAVIEGIRQFPIINSSVEGENIRYHRAVNLGVAVALDWGLIVPVVKNAEEKNFLGLQRAITDLAERARAKKLHPDEVQGGTFTITNPGVYGPLFGLPIINQPQVAILGIGGIFKTPIVKTDSEGNDYVAIGHIVHLSLGYDHRVIDGAIADQFLALVKKKLENWDEDIG